VVSPRRLLSFHLTSGARDIILSKDGPVYLKRFGEIGARDPFTLKMVRSAGPKTYFSACMTLTLQRPKVQRDENLIVSMTFLRPP
jgi:hypothetical protein